MGIVELAMCLHLVSSRKIFLEQRRRLLYHSDIGLEKRSERRGFEIADSPLEIQTSLGGIINHTSTILH